MTDRFCVTDYGAVPNGQTKNTDAFRRAIEACSAAGGGTVVVPAGTFLTGAIRLKSRLTLHLEAGATLLFSRDFDDYPTVESRWAGTELFMYSPLLFGKDLEDVAITGRGTIDGNPQAWWDYFYQQCGSGVVEPATDREREFARLNRGRYENTDCGGCGLEAQILRPPLVQLNNCRHVRLDGFTVQNSPFWNTHLVYCRNVTVHDVTFRNPTGAPNGDGLDIDSCSGVRVSNSCFDVNDDCLCLKAGMNEDGHRVGKPTENVTITNCTMLRGHGGVVLGSDGAGGIRNVTVSNCVFVGTDRGIRLKSNRGRFSRYEDLRFTNIIMQDVMCPLVMNLYYTCGATDQTVEMVSDPNPRPVLPSTPGIRNVHISHVTARGRMAAAGVLVGLPEQPIENVTLDEVVIDARARSSPCKPAMAFHLEEMCGEGIHARHVRGLALRNCHVSAAKGPALHLADASDVELSGVKLEPREADQPAVRLERVDGASVRGCRGGAPDAPFLEVRGAGSRHVRFADNEVGDRVESVRVLDGADGALAP